MRKEAGGHGKKLSPVSLVGERLDAVKTGIVRRGEELIDLQRYSFLEHCADTLYQIEYPPEFFEQFKTFILEGRVPIMYSNHQSHADSILLAQLAAALTRSANEVLSENGSENFKGFLLPIAVSLASGHQGCVAKNWVEFARPWFKKKNLFERTTLRRKDATEHKLESSEIEGYTVFDPKEVLAGTYGIAICPEGSMQGGRINKNDPGKHIYGMQKLEKNDKFGRLLEFLGKQLEGKVLLIPVGIENGRKVLNPTTKLPSREALQHFVFPQKTGLVQVQVGNCIAYEDLVAELQQENIGISGDSMSHRLMVRLALLLTDPYARGYYNQFVDKQ